MKRYIAPIIITIIMVIYAIGMIAALAAALEGVPFLFAVLIVAGPFLGGGLAVAVLVMRIKEIKGGEEDAARKY